MRGSFTLAIGDGANDINMLQKAHIGVGVMGKEGNQAAAFADYAVPQFKGLRRLIFWHGRSFGVRFSNFIKWHLFKSMNSSFILLFNNLQNGFSGEIVFTNWFFSLYDVSFTTIAILFYAIFEQDVSFKYTNQEHKLGFKLADFYRHCKE